MKTIVALVDFSDVTAQVLEQTTKLARAFDSQVVLLHVVPEEPAVVDLGLASPTIMSPPSEKRIEADSHHLRSLRESLVASGIKATARQLEKGTAAKVTDLCGLQEADLIVCGSHHHSTLYHLLVGTFTDEVLKRSTCPVLVVPAPRAERR